MAKQRRDEDESHGRSGLAVYAQLFLGMATFGSATPVSKIVTGAPPVFVGSGLRVAIGALVLAPFALKHWHQVGELSRRDWLLIGLISLFGMFGFSALMLYGMGMVSGVAGAIVMSTTPAVTTAVSILLLGDRPTWRKLAAVGLAVVWYGAGTLALGSWLWYAGIAKAEGTVAAAFMGVMPASALALSYLLLGESFRWVHLAGFLTVFLGVLLMSWEYTRMARRSG